MAVAVARVRRTLEIFFAQGGVGLGREYSGRGVFDRGLVATLLVQAELLVDVGSMFPMTLYICVSRHSLQSVQDDVLAGSHFAP